MKRIKKVHTVNEMAYCYNMVALVTGCNILMRFV